MVVAVFRTGLRVLYGGHVGLHSVVQRLHVFLLLIVRHVDLAVKRGLAQDLSASWRPVVLLSVSKLPRN